jgi:hypothetical protein
MKLFNNLYLGLALTARTTLGIAALCFVCIYMVQCAKAAKVQPATQYSAAPGHVLSTVRIDGRDYICVSWYSSTGEMINTQLLPLVKNTTAQ